MSGMALFLQPGEGMGGALRGWQIFSNLLSFLR